MASHDDLLKQGPRQAPEPETAEEKSRKLGLKTAGGVVAGGGAVAAKVGALAFLPKLFLWLFVWNGVSTAGRIGGWIGIAIAVGIIGFFLVHAERRNRA